MLDKLIHAFGFEAGLAVIVAGVWALAGRGVAMLVMGAFLVLCAILSEGAGSINLKAPLADGSAWLGDHLRRSGEV